MNRFITVLEHVNNKKNALTIAFLFLYLLGIFASAANAGINEWTPIGPEGGAIYAMAIDPKNPATLYAGTDGGGVFQSTNGGTSWQAVNIGLTSFFVNALAIDPINPTTLYASTFGGGIFKSTNAGASWQAVNTGLTGLFVRAIAIDPINPSTLYAGIESAGVFKSTDGGASWQAINTGLNNLSIRAIAIDPINPSTVYVGINGAGVYKSTDGGASWQAMNAGLVNTAVFTLSIDPTSTAILYVGTFRGGVFKSINSGASWQIVSTGLTNPAVVNSLVIDPSNPATVYAGTGSTLFTSGSNGVFKSTNGGVSWSAVNTGLTNNTIVNSLAIDLSNPATVYSGTNAVGVFKSSNSGGSWQAANIGLTGVRVEDLGIDPNNPAIVYAASSSGVFKSTDSGLGWQKANIGLQNNGSFLAIDIDPNNPLILYAGTDSRGILIGPNDTTPINGVFKSTDGGESWQASNSGITGSNVTDIDINPSNPATVFASTSLFGCVFKSTDGGASWRDSSFGISGCSMLALAIDPANNAIVYAGSATGGVFKSLNGGASWRENGLTGIVVRDLAIDSSNPATVYAGTNNGIYKSTNGGTSWQAVNTGLTIPNVFALAIDPHNPTTLYGGTQGGGVFKSTDGGAGWQAVNTGLTNFSVLALAIDPNNPATLYAGTNGNSVFKITFAEGNPTVSLTTNSLTFTSQAVGTTSTSQSVTLTNNGTANLVLGALTFTGENPGDYTMVPNSCNTTPMPPNTDCSFSVAFKPTATGTRTAAVNIPSNAAGSPHLVALSGTGVPLDTDSDGMPDDFEIANGLNPNDPSDAGLDSDGDGLTNLQEFQEGTNPKKYDQVVYLDWNNPLSIQFVIKRPETPPPLGIRSYVPSPGESDKAIVPEDFKTNLLDHVKEIFRISDISIPILNYAGGKGPLEGKALFVRFTPSLTQDFDYTQCGKNKRIPGNALLGWAYEKENPDRFNKNKGGEVAVFIDTTNDLEKVAQTIAHEVGHALGLRHIVLPQQSFPGDKSPEVMEYNRADIVMFNNIQAEITEPPDRELLSQPDCAPAPTQTEGTHNPVYHLRRYSLNESKTQLVNQGIHPGNVWDVGGFESLWNKILLFLDKPLYDMAILGPTGTAQLDNGGEGGFNTLAFFKLIDPNTTPTVGFFSQKNLPLHLVASSTPGEEWDLFFSTGNPLDPLLIAGNDPLSGSIFQYFKETDTFTVVGTFLLTTEAIATISSDDFISVIPSSLDFGEVKKGDAKELQLAIQNTGEETLAGTCTDEPPFTFVAGCPFSVPAGQSSKVTVRFNPITVGPSFAGLVITSNGGDALVKAEGLTIVVYNYSGFFSPVDNLPIQNKVKAGSAVPLKFSLAGNQGLDIFSTGYPKSQSISCDLTAPIDAIEETVTASNSGLTYDAANDQYKYVWKTTQSWKGTCRQLIVKLNDGSEHKANFIFK